MKQRPSLWLTLAVALVLVVCGLGPAQASFLVPQTKVDPQSLTKYLNPLPFFGPVAGRLEHWHSDLHRNLQGITTSQAVP